MSQRRRKSYGVKRPKSQTSIVTTIIGAVSIGLYFLFLSLTMIGFAAGARAMSCIGVISAVVSVMAISRSIEPFRDVSFDTLTRWLGLLFPIAGFLIWIITYFVGIFLG